MKRHGKTGATGPRGPQGADVATGMTGGRVNFGKAGKHKPKRLGPPRQEDEELDMIARHFDDVFQQLNEYRRLTAKIQRVVNGFIAARCRLPKA